MKTMTKKIAGIGFFTFDKGWIRKEKLKLWNKNFDIDIIMSAYSDEDISKSQKDSYMWLKSNVDYFSSESQQLMEKYINDYKDEILPYIDEPIPYKKLIDLVKPTSIIFFNTGSFGIICSCEWDEEDDLVVYVDSSKKIIVSPSDILSQEEET